MSNSYAKDFLERAKDRFSIDSVSMSYTDWVIKNTTIKGRPFSLKGYEFQRAILDDMHQNLSCIKISQVGITEIQIRKALAFLKRNTGTSVIYSLPNEDMFTRVSDGRVKPIVNADKVFNSNYDRENKAIRSKSMQQFDQSFLYIVPAIESAATSINADFVMNDETDLSDQKMISLFHSRLQGSKYRISQRFSTPSFPAFGIDLDFQSSDQMHYELRCEHCGHWQHPEFTREFVHLPGMPDVEHLYDIGVEYQDELDFASCYVKCNHCEKPLNLDGTREWVARYPTRVNSRGYRINPFVTSNLGVPYIFQSLWNFLKTDNRRGFHNTVLGHAYTDGSIQIPEAKIRECFTTQVNPKDLKSYENLWVGIDVGQICHITIGSGTCVENTETVCFYQIHVDDLVRHVTKLCKDYKVRGGAIDRHPYEPTADEVLRVTGGKIMPTEYRGTKDANPVKDPYGDITHFQVNRTWLLDQFASTIRNTTMRISGYAHLKEVYVEHLRAMVRDETPEKPAEWIKLNNNDHFFHSSALMLGAIEIAGVVKVLSKANPRTMILEQIVQTRDKTSNLIGVSAKRFDGERTNR